MPIDPAPPAPLAVKPPSNTPVLVALAAVVAAIIVVGYFAFFNTGVSVPTKSPAASVPQK